MQSATKSLQIFSIIVVLLALIGTANGCSKDGNINIFSVADDIELGQQLAAEIANDPATYPILDPVQYANSYAYLDDMVNTILNSGQLDYRDEFVWDFKIVQNDTVLNAFCAPGGYIYVYTGLIKFLDSASHLAGVLGHEIAHADKRHSSEQLTKAYGVELLLSLLGRSDSLSNDTTANSTDILTEVATSLVFLAYSRKNESQADEFSVIYLNPTKYEGKGAAGFFEKLNETNQGASGPAFLSTHPDPDNRIENIVAKWEELGSLPAENPDQLEADYAAFKASLP